MAGFLTNKGAYLLNVGTVIWTSSTIKAMLLKSTATIDQDDNTVSQIVASECDATGYVGGFAGADRLTLGTKSTTENDTSNRIEMDAANIPWTAIGGATNNTLRYVAIIRENTNDADSDVLGYVQFTSDVNTNGGDVTAQIDAAGVFNLTT